MTRFPKVLAAVEAWEANKHETADWLAQCLGQPPERFATCIRMIKQNFRPGYFDDYGGAKGAAMMWRAAAAFPLETRREYGVALCSEAGDPTTLANAADYAERSGKRLDKHLIKLIKRAMTLQEEQRK